MSIFDKKIQEMLERSPEHVALKSRVTTLEAQVVSLSKALSDAMRAYTDLARITIDNRKSLEEVYAYLTDPLGEGVEQSDATSEMTSEMTPEELAEYKRNLN